MFVSYLAMFVSHYRPKNEPMAAETMKPPWTALRNGERLLSELVLVLDGLLSRFPNAIFPWPALTLRRFHMTNCIGV